MDAERFIEPFLSKYGLFNNAKGAFRKFDMVIDLYKEKLRIYNLRCNANPDASMEEEKSGMADAHIGSLFPQDEELEDFL